MSKALSNKTNFCMYNVLGKNIIPVEMGNDFYTKYTKLQSVQMCTYAHRSACQCDWGSGPNRKGVMWRIEILNPIIYEMVDTYLLFLHNTYEILPETGIWFTNQE